MTIPPYIKVTWPAPNHVRAYVSTKAAGNLANHVTTDVNQVANNRNRLMKDLLLPSSPHWLNQVHGDTVLELPPAIYAKPLTADAAFTQKSNCVAVILTADCLPLLMTNKQGTVVAAIHAGWQGLLKGVIDNTISALLALNIVASELIVWLGPAISQRAFAVGHEVFESYVAKDPAFKEAFIPYQDRWQLDLYQAARIILYRFGINAIHGGNFCTYEDQDYFYSHRRDVTHQQQPTTGRMASFIWLGH